MAVPKRKQSKARKGWRNTHKVEHVMAITHCANCNGPLRTHQTCATCGFYKGIKVLTTKAERAVKRGQALKTKEARKEVREGKAATSTEVQNS